MEGQFEYETNYLILLITLRLSPSLIETVGGGTGFGGGALGVCCEDVGLDAIEFSLIY